MSNIAEFPKKFSVFLSCPVHGGDEHAIDLPFAYDIGKVLVRTKKEADLYLEEQIPMLKCYHCDRKPVVRKLW